MPRSSLRIGSRVKVVNPDRPNLYEQFGTIIGAPGDKWSVEFVHTVSRFHSWELMEVPQYGTTPDGECGRT